MLISFMNVQIELVEEGTKKLKIITPSINSEYFLDFSVVDERVELPLDDTLNVILEPVGKEKSMYGVFYQEVVGLQIFVENPVTNTRMIKMKLDFKCQD